MVLRSWAFIHAPPAIVKDMLRKVTLPVSGLDRFGVLDLYRFEAV
jgi:hypothetical protein